MKFKLFLSVFSLFIISAGTASAQVTSDKNYLAQAGSEGDAAAEATETYQRLGDQDWRTSQNIPYSQPVVINDPFDGDYLAVIDHNFSGDLFLYGVKSGVVTNWSEDFIRVYSYVEESCGRLFCANNVRIHESNSLEIKIGEEVFRLTGTNGNFEVSPELASALGSAPAGPALTRLRFEESGETLTNEIGSETTAAWHVVYGSEH